MTAASATTDPALARSKRINPLLAGALWIVTAGLYEVYWYWTARRQVAEELGKPANPVPGAAAMFVVWAVGIGLIVSQDGIAGALGLTIIPLGWAPILYPLWQGINELRDKVGAPRFAAFGYALSMAVPFICLVIIHYPLKSVIFEFNVDSRAIFDGVGYAVMVSLPYTFAYGLGYLNEYWLEREGSPDLVTSPEDVGMSPDDVPEELKQ